MELELRNKIYSFTYDNVEDSWYCHKKISLTNHDLFFEIHLKVFYNKEINWNLLPEFLDLVEEELPKGLDIDSQKLLFEMLWNGSINNIEKYRFNLAGLYYKEPKLPIYSFDKIEFNYSLVYKLFNSDYIECDDPYTNYVVDIKNGSAIVGCRKE